MDRNGKLPSKGTVLVPMLVDVLLSMQESHMDFRRSLQQQNAAKAAAAALAAAATAASATTNAAPVNHQLPPSIAAPLEASTGASKGEISPHDLGYDSSASFPNVKSPTTPSASNFLLTSPSQGAGTPASNASYVPTLPPAMSTIPSSQQQTAVAAPPAAANALFGASSTSASSLGSGGPAKDPSSIPARAAQLGVTESDLAFSYRLFRHLIDAVLQERDCVEVAGMDATRKLLPPLQLLAPLDHTMALYVCTLIINLCAVKDAKVVLSSTALDLFEFVMSLAAHYVMERRLMHLALMTISNLVTCDAIDPTPRHCEKIVLLMMPHYAEVHVVEAWCCALCNITAQHPHLVPEFVRLGVVETIERLLLFLGDDNRFVTRGLQCLSNLSCHNGIAAAA